MGSLHGKLAWRGFIKIFCTIIFLTFLCNFGSFYEPVFSPMERDKYPKNYIKTSFAFSQKDKFPTISPFYTNLFSKS